MTTPRTPTGLAVMAKPDNHAVICALNIYGQEHCTCSVRTTVCAIEAEAAQQERERLIAEGWREPHRHSFTSFGVDDLHPEARCAGESCGVLYGELHPEPA